MRRDSWRSHKVLLFLTINSYWIPRWPVCCIITSWICLHVLWMLACVLGALGWSVCILFSGQILQKDQEIKDLKQKIAEVMAVMPSISYTADTSSMTPVAPHYSSKFMDTNPSGLDPNASVYQPLKKWTLHSPPNISVFTPAGPPPSHHLRLFSFPLTRSEGCCVVWLFVVVKTKDKKNINGNHVK